MILTPILIVPAAVGLVCLWMRSRRLMSALGVFGFASTLALGVRLLGEILARGPMTECGEFFYADALSGWMVLLISSVSLGTSLYAGRYFQRDLADGLPAMALLLGGLLVFSAWLPAPLLEVIQQAARIIGGKR